MKKISKSNLSGLKILFPVYGEEAMKKVIGGLSTDDWASFLLSYLGDSGRTYVDSNGNLSWHVNNGSWQYPYTQSQFENSPQWYGGFVEGWGYVLPEVVIYGQTNVANPNKAIPFNIYGLNWNGEGVGINSSCGVNGNVVFDGNSVTILANINGATVSGAETFGVAKLKVDGNVVAIKALTKSSGGYYTNPNNGTPLGEARFDLSSYRGHVEITMQAGYKNSNPGGAQWGNTSEKTVYSAYR